MTPRATCRLQLHGEFGFDAAAKVAPYLARLGISHLYLSPILRARAGSMHGYDVVDPGMVNPELGGEDGFRALVARLRELGLGVIVDIVPNHMAVGGADNPWWLDLLERGRASPHADTFDIDWEPADPALHDRIAAPFLGEPYGEALASGELSLLFDAALGKLAFAYHDHRFPLRPEDYAEVMDSAPEPAQARLERYRSPEALHALAERQHFRLSWWRTAGDTINWRRFFDVTELAGLAVERPHVFEAVHATTLRLYAEGLIDGLRIDHVDGLADPAGYCRRLRARLDELAEQRPPGAPAGRAYLVVEKILAGDEQLPRDWETDGTSGYDFMNAVSALQHDGAGASALGTLWHELSGRPADFHTEEALARRQILRWSFTGQLDATAAAFAALARATPDSRDLTGPALRRAIALLVERFPAYRTYADPDHPADPGPAFSAALEAAKRDAAPGEQPMLDFIAGIMAGGGPGDAELRRDAMRRLNQLLAPVAAKAVEDTAFYRHGRLLSRNDVGFDPACFSLDADSFHRLAGDRAGAFPAAMLTTATHDHKRGEDVRARLAVLSGRAAEWREAVTKWFALAAQVRPARFDAGDEYLLYQTMIGAWPPDLAPDDAPALAAFGERLAGWQEKALREAKLRSSWAEPDAGYEAAGRVLIEALTDPARSAAFLRAMHAFVERIAPEGALNGLVQAALRCALAGVPDLYQGTEFWDFSLVDPDNRRPVDFAARAAALDRGVAPADLLDSWRDGAVKQALIARLLDLRAREPALGTAGSYRPLAVTGPRAEHVLAFARQSGSSLVLVAVPLRMAGLSDGRLMSDAAIWQGTSVSLPAELASVALTDALGDARQSPPAKWLDCAELFARFPVAVLTAA